MTNAEKFIEVFNIHATELWAKPENEFLKWINSEYKLSNQSHGIKNFVCHHCGRKYAVHSHTEEYDEAGFYYYYSECPSCGASNEVNDCYWR